MRNRNVHRPRSPVRHLLDLINDVLDLSKIESGRMELDLEAVDVSHVVEDTLHGIAHAAATKGIRIENIIGSGMVVIADRVRLREILTNLLSNAVKFTEQGGSIRIAAEREGKGMVRIDVQDSGVGIAPGDQLIIFDKFRQVGSTTKGVREGTGLGLAIARNLVEMHGGQISVTSVPGEGSCFSFTVPSVNEPEGDSPVVMIVEDDPGAGELIAGYLNPLGSEPN